MKDCKCYEVEAKIKKDNLGCNWNLDAACSAWRYAAEEMVDNNIQFEAHSDEVYGCTCPTCGRMICGWCV